jgi:hypothetical protein
LTDKGSSEERVDDFYLGGLTSGINNCLLEPGRVWKAAIDVDVYEVFFWEIVF